MASMLLKSQQGAMCNPVRASSKAPLSSRVLSARRIVCRSSDRETNPEGFIARDNSGKGNMYPVLPKAYEVGSAADTTGAGAASIAYAVGGGAVAAAAIGLALVTGQTASSPAIDASAYEQYSSLSTYSNNFAAELGLKKVKAAPAPAVVEAPAAVVPEAAAEVAATAE